MSSLVNAAKASGYCYSETNYVWNVQPYSESASERNHGIRVILDLSYSLKGHNFTSDNFSLLHMKYSKCY